MGKKRHWLFALLAIGLMLPVTFAAGERVCGVYFTKIGCPVCAKTDPIILGQWLPTRPDAVVIEYVFTGWYEPNAVLMGEYNLAYGTGGAVPLMIKNAEEKWAGIPAFYSNEDILRHVEDFFSGDLGECLLKDREVSFDEINLNQLPEKPKIWSGNRLLKRTGEASIDSAFLRKLLFAGDLAGTLAESQYEIREVKAEPAPYSGGEIPFAQAVDIGGGWVLKLREKIELPENVKAMEPNGNGGNGSNGGENGGDGSEPAPSQESMLLVSISLIVACIIALAVFIKVKGK